MPSPLLILTDTNDKSSPGPRNDPRRTDGGECGVRCPVSNLFVKITSNGISFLVMVTGGANFFEIRPRNQPTPSPVTKQMNHCNLGRSTRWSSPSHTCPTDVAFDLDYWADVCAQYGIQYVYICVQCRRCRTNPYTLEAARYHLVKHLDCHLSVCATVINATSPNMDG